MTWLEQTVVGFDTETTGVSTTTDRIVTAAVITRTGIGADAAISTRTWLINPGIPIPPGSTAVHGITDAQVQAGGQAPADALGEIADVLAAALSAGFPVVAFNAQFDISILESELARHGLESLASRLGGKDVRPVVDPLVLDRHLDKWRRGKRKLINMCETYGVQVEADDLHAADADVLATLNVIQAIAVKYPELGAVALNDLHDQQVEAHRVWATEFSAWLTKQGKVDNLPSPVWPVAAQ